MKSVVLNQSEIKEASNIHCRLCQGAAAPVFQKILIGKYTVSFLRCARCGSLQSEEPFWLAEAYSPAVDAIDTGAAQRVLHCLALTHCVMRLFGYRTALDFGGGSGLLCRLLRDAGRDAYWYDQYSRPGYATGFVGSPRDTYDLITSFEVIEHFANPRDDLEALFAGRPKALLLMTELYTGQGGDWSYLAPEEGQHIFFYSQEALRLIGVKYGYHLQLCRGFIVFLREAPTSFQRWILQTVLRPRIMGWAKLMLLAGGGVGAQKDYEILRARVSDAARRK